MPSYSEKLRDPRWQRRRLEILERDGFACAECGDETNTLHVHHGYYERGLEPWEYLDDTLWSLCATCHEALEAQLLRLRKALARMGRGDLAEIEGAVVALEFDKGLSDRFRPCDPDKHIRTATALGFWRMSLDDKLPDMFEFCALMEQEPWDA